jgi:ketosteroid isomerase-like protein
MRDQWKQPPGARGFRLSASGESIEYSLLKAMSSCEEVHEKEPDMNEKGPHRSLAKSSLATPASIALVALFSLLLLTAFSPRPVSREPESDDAAIVTLLTDQTAAWNRGDIEGFVSGYWNSNLTEFVSSEGVSRGRQALLERYRRSYPDRKAMGHLTFSNLEIRVECPTAAYAVGEYHLQRENDNPSGIFTLNLRKLPEGWRIVVDHTTAFAKPALSTK